MFLAGIGLCVIGLVHGVFKYFVICSAARDVYDGRPVMDFVVVVPLWFCVGGSLFVAWMGYHPSLLVAIEAYAVLAALFYVVMQSEYRKGRPERERQLERIGSSKHAEPDTPPNGGPAKPLGNSGASSGPPSVS